MRNIVFLTLEVFLNENCVNNVFIITCKCRYVSMSYIMVLIFSFLAYALPSWGPVVPQRFENHVLKQILPNPALSFQKTLTVCESDMKL